MYYLSKSNNETMFTKNLKEHEKDTFEPINIFLPIFFVCIILFFIYTAFSAYSFKKNHTFTQELIVKNVQIFDINKFKDNHQAGFDLTISDLDNIGEKYNVFIPLIATTGQFPTCDLSKFNVGKKIDVVFTLHKIFDKKSNTLLENFLIPKFNCIDYT